MKKPKILIFWEGFPACGLLTKKVLENFDVKLIATKAKVPFKDLEKLLGYEIIWIDELDDIWNIKERFRDRELIIHTGWGYKNWLKFDKWIKEKNDAKVIVVVDNNFKKTMRQFLGSIYFKLVLKKYFDGAFVPGREGIKLMTFFGMPYNRIYVGNYGSYEKIYFEKIPIEKRNNEFLFVGQLIERKSVDIMIEAFKEYKKLGGKWDLRILGDGKLRNICKGDGIIFEGFTQPHLVADKMNKAKVFVLLSKEEHWGTVVCEAAACGMHILTYKKVGSAIDIVRNNINGIVLDSLDINNIVRSFFYYENINNDLLKNGSIVSKTIAKGYDSMAYYSAVSKMVYDFFGEKK